MKIHVSWRAVAALIVVGASFGASAANASASPVPPTPASAPATSGFTLWVDGQQYRPSNIQADLTSPGCGTGVAEATIVSEWERHRPEGVAILRCGTQASYGLRHINNGHGQDWQNILNAYPVGGTWSQLAIFAAQQTTEAPASAPYNSGNDTYTYSAPLQIKNSEGEVVRTYTVITPVGNASNNVITDYPTNGR